MYFQVILLPESHIQLNLGILQAFLSIAKFACEFREGEVENWQEEENKNKNKN